MKICRKCEMPLRFELGKGWLHPGGGLYVQWCKNCGWINDGPTVSECGKCNSRKDLIDDHCAQPVERKS